MKMKNENEHEIKTDDAAAGAAASAAARAFTTVFTVVSAVAAAEAAAPAAAAASIYQQVQLIGEVSILQNLTYYNYVQLINCWSGPISYLLIERPRANRTA